ncbi:hypothetical protein [Kosakonia sp.]|uniref:DUF7716 domain-containing protein n=1 Tax=Kosakonia sp. TaxID=1916651 RepID=UPI002896BC86|nr:hypothetical protein [Kosakonia sp.]
MLTKNRQYSLAEIIDWINETDCQDDNFCLYGTGEKLTAEGIYLFAGYPQVEDDTEIYPPAVIENELEYLYSGEDATSVIMLVNCQKPGASLDEYIRALNYYYENDNFLDVN